MNYQRIDALVAEHVMNTPPGHGGSFSTDISAAWAVVERLNGSVEAPEFTLRENYDGMWTCKFVGRGSRQFAGTGYSNTAASAVCLAALAAKGITP